MGFLDTLGSFAKSAGKFAMDKSKEMQEKQILFSSKSDRELEELVRKRNGIDAIVANSILKKERGYDDEYLSKLWKREV